MTRALATAGFDQPVAVPTVVVAMGQCARAAARAMLTNSAVPVRSDDVGGHRARSITVDPATLRVIVQTIRDGARCL